MELILAFVLLPVVAFLIALWKQFYLSAGFIVFGSAITVWGANYFLQRFSWGPSSLNSDTNGDPFMGLLYFVMFGVLTVIVSFAAVFRPKAKNRK